MPPTRRPPTQSRLPSRGGNFTLWITAFVVLAAIHVPYLKLPYYWDELGQFVPQTLDLYSEGRWIPVHTLPNVHPPGLEAILALLWRVTGGPSILVSRLSMLAIAAYGVVGSFLLSIRLSRKSAGAPAFAVLLLLLASPLFYTQSMMVQLDMPAMVFTVWALLYFLDGRLWRSVLMATVAVLFKETAVVLPVVLAVWLIAKERDFRKAAHYLIPCAAIAGWVAFVWRATGHPFGDPAFSQYNTWYALQPVRLSMALLRRIFYLFFAEFRWIGAAAVVWAWRKTDWLRSPEWGVAAAFGLVHIVVVSAFGGAVLERYLCPVLPIVFTAFAISWMSLEGQRLRLLVPGLALTGSLLSMVWYPAYPFPYENNLAMMDFVAIHQLAADYIASEPGIKTVATAWPLTDALRRPEFGYVSKPVEAVELHDFRASNLAYARAKPVDALVLYSREWNPGGGGGRRFPIIRRFLSRYYDYAPPATAPEIESAVGLHPQFRWEHRGMWIEVYR
jgi:hypothetical protein